jgi:hypothetical protein
MSFSTVPFGPTVKGPALNQNTGNDRRNKKVTDGIGPQPSAVPPQATRRPLPPPQPEVRPLSTPQSTRRHSPPPQTQVRPIPSQSIYMQPGLAPVIPTRVPVIPTVFSFRQEETLDPNTKAKRELGIPTQQVVKTTIQPTIYTAPASVPHNPGRPVIQQPPVLLQQPPIVLQQPPVILQQPRPPIYMPIPVPVHQPATTTIIHPAPAPQQPQTVIYQGRKVTTGLAGLFRNITLVALLIIPTVLFFTVSVPLNIPVTLATASTLVIIALISHIIHRRV